MIISHYKKKLGQNFLVDKNIKNNIINTIKIKNTDILIEIGPGDGALSYDIFKLPKKFISIEIDKDLFLKLKRNIKNKNVKMYNDDILKFDFKNLVKKYKKLRIIGNIPYNISSQIILNLIKISDKIEDVHLIIQEDFAKKLIKKCNIKNYFVFYVQNYFNIKKIFNIKPNSFYPRPKIKSTFTKFIPIKNKKNILDINVFEKFVKKICTKKRKNIINSENFLIKFKRYININKKIETLNSNDLIRISNLISVCKND